LILKQIGKGQVSYPQKPPLGIVSGASDMKSKPVYQQKPGTMKTATGHFLERLIATMPIEAMRKSSSKSRKLSGQAPRLPWGSTEENLHRIFMARYRMQHL
jgi:hypothetical protein